MAELHSIDVDKLKLSKKSLALLNEKNHRAAWRNEISGSNGDVEWLSRAVGQDMSGDVAEIRSMFRRTRLPAGRKVLIHGDLAWCQMLERDGRLRAVIDWDTLQLSANPIWDFGRLYEEGIRMEYILAEYNRLTGSDISFKDVLLACEHCAAIGALNTKAMRSARKYYLKILKMIRGELGRIATVA